MISTPVQCWTASFDSFVYEHPFYFSVAFHGMHIPWFIIHSLDVYPFIEYPSIWLMDTRLVSGFSFFFFFWFFFFIISFGCTGSSSLSAGSLKLSWVGATLLKCVGFLWLLLLHSTGSRPAGFSSCSTEAQKLWFKGPRARAQKPWHTGLVAPQHMEYSRTRGWTHVPYTGMRILIRCTTREVQFPVLDYYK